MSRLPLRIVPVLLALAAVALAALAAANTVPASRVGAFSAATSANSFKPPECAALDLVEIRVGGGSGGGNSLVLGTAGNDNLVGASGDDCLVGGAGNDSLKGNAGTDVCIGGPGLDSFHQSCETRIQSADRHRPEHADVSAGPESVRGVGMPGPRAEDDVRLPGEQWLEHLG